MKTRKYNDAQLLAMCDDPSLWHETLFKEASRRFLKVTSVTPWNDVAARLREDILKGK